MRTARPWLRAIGSAVSRARSSCEAYTAATLGSLSMRAATTLAWRCPSSARCRPGACPGSTLPVVGVCPWRTRRTRVGRTRRLYRRARILEAAPDVRSRAVEVGEPVRARELRGADRLLVPAAPVGIRGEGGDGAPDVARRLGEREIGRSLATLDSGIEMIDRDPRAEPRDERGRLLDGLGPVVLGPRRPAAAARAHDRGARLVQGRRDSAPGAAGRARHDGHAPAQRVAVGRPGHGSSLPALGLAYKRRLVVARIEEIAQAVAGEVERQGQREDR